MAGKRHNCSNSNHLTRRRLLQLAGIMGAGGTIVLVMRTARGLESKGKTARSSSGELKLTEFPFETVTVNARGEEAKRETGKVKFYAEDLDDWLKLEMVAIPGGKLAMGSPEGEGSDEERPQHGVTIQPFFLGKFPVTQIQWQAIAALPKVKRDLKPKPSYFRGDALPVERVNWYDAEEFCARLGKKTGRDYRLPSEAEWEYACRAGKTTPFHFGETITSDLANYRGNFTYAKEPRGDYRKETTLVGSFPPNAFGLYDMHGNLWEWCADHWHENYEGAPSNGSPWLSERENQSRLLRGGSWFINPQYCRSAYRYGYRPFYYSNSIGFRVAVSSKKLE